MGIRAAHGKPKQDIEKAKAKSKQQRQQQQSALKADEFESAQAHALNQNESVLDTDVDTTYKPSTSESIAAYELLIKFIVDKFEQQRMAVMHSIAHELISIIKNDSLTQSSSKMKALHAQFGEYTLFEKKDLDFLQRCCRKMNDFGAQNDGIDIDERAARENNRIVPIKSFKEESDSPFYADAHNEDDDSGDDRIEPEMEDPATKQREMQRQRQMNKKLKQIESEQMNVDNDNNVATNKNLDTDVIVMSDENKLDPKEVDAYWLQGEIRKNFPNLQDEAKEISDSLLSILEISNKRQLENKVSDVLGFDNWEFSKRMLKNKDIIVWCTKLKRASNENERKQIEKEMSLQPHLCKILEDLQATYGTEKRKIAKLREKAHYEAVQIRKQQEQSENAKELSSATTIAQSDMHNDNDLSEWNAKYEKIKLDLSALSFREGGHFMSSTEWKLRKGSKYFNKKGYQEIFVPHIAAPPKQIELKSISELPKWAQSAFYTHGEEEDDEQSEDDDEDVDMKKKKPAISHLNAVQSQCYKMAFESSENILLSAPTGAGKTNVAMLCILREIGKHLNADSHSNNVSVRSEEFKIVYIAPMKSLVREVVLKFSKRLAWYGLKVAELSGDQQLSREQIAETCIIVTTPEKWDIITRKGMDRNYASMVSLIIVDEIHLLHDLRGSVLESIISRTIRNIEMTQNLVRIIGLSATMPNYGDIADFLRVKKNRGLFVFGSAFRPIPLISRFAGVTLKKPFKQFALMNDLCYQYVEEQCRNDNQVIIFVHSRKETANTAKMLLEKFKTDNKAHIILSDDSADREILESEAANEDGDILSSDLLELLPFGFGIHNAGMSRSDRVLVEDLFKAKVLRVLVSTATLAWGVNMPAHSVIIKGTQIYNAAQSKWTELSMLDILQMFGRAGRPDTGDKYGEAYLITTHRELKYYMPLLNDQLPIESQLIHRLPDCLNAEIVLGTVSNIKQCVEWLGCTYLNVRMKKAPKIYQLNGDGNEELKQRQIDLCHSALLELRRSGLCEYDERSGVVESTELGRIASFYYISHKTMSEYDEALSAQIINDIEIFKIFSLSAEFKYISVREGEKSELVSLLDRVPIPIKESIDSSCSKINVLLQAYISRLKLSGFALISDMCYVQQSAARLMRCLFEIALQRKWAYVAFRCLTICKMIQHRQWSIESPLRQFGVSSIKNKLTHSILSRIEKCQFSFDRFAVLSSTEIGELIRMPSVGRDIYKLIHQIPRLSLRGQIQPITRSCIKIELSIDADFEWNDFYHGESQQFWIFVEDVDGETILHSEYFVLYKKLKNSSHKLSFSIKISEPLPPQYFVRITSDKWLGSCTVLPISFRNLILPKKYYAKTELLDLQKMPIDHAKIWTMDKSISHFNSIQTQIWQNLWNSNENLLLCAPSYCGKTSLAQIAMIKMLNEYPSGKCLYISSHSVLICALYKKWAPLFGESNNVIVAKLDDDDSIQSDLAKFKKSQIILSTPTNFDRIQRGWRKRKIVQNLNLFIADNLHFVGCCDANFNGAIYEMIVSRQRMIQHSLNIPTRFIGFCQSISNAKNLANWFGVKNSKFLYNFDHKMRPCPYKIFIRSSDIQNFESRHISFFKKCFSFCRSANAGQTLIWCSSAKHCRRLASDIVAASIAKSSFLNLSVENFLPFLNKSTSIKAGSGLYKCLLSGVGFIHCSQSDAIKADVCRFYKSGAIKILIVEKSLLFKLESFDFKRLRPLTSSVIFYGTQYFCGHSHNFVDYSLFAMVQMMSFITTNNGNGRVLICCHSNKEEYFDKFLICETFPIESHLDTASNFEDAMNAEIVSSSITTADEAMDFITWTFYYYRLTQNPNYYNLRGTADDILSQHLSEVIEAAFHRLYNANCISVDEQMDVSPLNNGLIASFYYITYTTIEFFYSAIYKIVDDEKKSLKMKNILEILSFSSEFEEALTLRKGEEKTIRKILKYLPMTVVVSNDDELMISTKVNVLLQTHFMRKAVHSAQIARDRNFILSKSQNLLYSMIDILSTAQILNGVLLTIQMLQMITQSMWQSDSYLLQLPYFTTESAKRFEDEFGVKNVYDLLEMEDDERICAFGAIKMNEKQMRDIAIVCNEFPDIEVAIKEVAFESEEGDIRMIVYLEREDEEEQDGDDKRMAVPIVNSPRFPLKKYETWYLVVANKKENKICFIKRFQMKTVSQTFKIKFNAAKDAKYTLLLMSDSYLGCDQFLDVPMPKLMMN